MVVKRSSKSQIVIPKAILDRAGLGPKDIYFDVTYENGRIVLTPVQFEEKIPVESLKRFEDRTLKQEKEDEVYGSVDEAIRGLRRRRRR